MTGIITLKELILSRNEQSANDSITCKVLPVLPEVIEVARSRIKTDE